MNEKLITKSTKEIFEDLKLNILKSGINNNGLLEIENDLEVLNILRKILYIEIDVENGVIDLNDNITCRSRITRYIGENNAEIVKNWLNRKPDDEYEDFYGSLNNTDKKGENNMYNEIFKLKELLEKGNIPFEFKNFHDGYQIIIKNKNNFRIADAIENKYSYGVEEDLLEIMGGLTEEEEEFDSVLGGLSSEEVFKRFKYCYENNTRVYKDN